MIRIMIICSFLFGLLLAVILGFSIELMIEDSSLYSADSQSLTKNIIVKEKNKQNQKMPPELSIMKESWGKDVFHNRSNTYESWFKLTGITRFENGYKAIINENIFLEGDRVRGFTLKKISANRVILKRGKYRVTLKLDK